MSKQREEEPQVEDNEVEQEDTSPEITVEEKDGQQVAVSDGLSRSERRRQKREAEMRALVGAEMKPVLDALAQLRQVQAQPQVQYVPPPQVPATPKDGTRDEWLKRSRRQEDIVQQMSGAKDQETINRLRDEWHDLEYEKSELVAKRHVSEFGERFSQEHPKQPPPEEALLRTEFSDVLSAGPEAANYAKGIFLQEFAKAKRSGKPVNEWEIHRRALTQAAKDLGIRQDPAPKPNPSQQARFGGAAPSSSGSGGAAFSRPLTGPEKAMAIAASPKGTPANEAYARWAKQAGPEYFKENP